MNRSGCARRIVSYIRMPPNSVLMPQPCPTVSADQANVTSRGCRRRGEKASGRRRADVSRVVEIFEAHTIEDPLTRRQAGKVDARGKARRLAGRRRLARAACSERIRSSTIRRASVRGGRCGSRRSRGRASRRRWRRRKEWPAGRILPARMQSAPAAFNGVDRNVDGGFDSCDSCPHFKV